MLKCNICGWSGTDLIPHPDGTARCPRCITIFAGIPASNAIYDLDSENYEYRTKPYMNKVKGSWVFAAAHYWKFKEHYDTAREADRKMPCKVTGKSRVWEDGITVTKRCLYGNCRECTQTLRIEPNK